MIRQANLLFFQHDGYGSYRQENHPLGQWTLTGNWTEGFVLQGTDGAREEFSPAGLRTAVVDRAGNRTSFHYQDTNGDGRPGTCPLNPKLLQQPIPHPAGPRIDQHSQSPRGFLANRGPRPLAAPAPRGWPPPESPPLPRLVTYVQNLSKTVSRCR